MKTRRLSRRFRRRAPRRLPRVRRIGRNVRRNLGIPARTHLVKRLGEPIVVNNVSELGNILPVLTQDGNGSFELGSANAEGGLASTYSYGLAAKFKLSSVIQEHDITQMFDRYKIVGVALKILYQNNNSSVAGNQPLPAMWYAFDGDDSTVPTQYQDVMVKGYCKQMVLNGTTFRSWYCKPRVDKLVYQEGLTSAYTSERAPFIDCNSDDVPHYGFKAWIANWSVLAIDHVLRIQPIYYLALKDTQ